MSKSILDWQFLNILMAVKILFNLGLNAPKQELLMVFYHVVFFVQVGGLVQPLEE